MTEINNKENKELDKILITSLTPYFLEKENFWFEKNLNEILKERKTQSFFEDNIILLEKDQQINASHLLRKLDEMGYEIVQQISDLGELSRIGGTIDIFPLNCRQAVRIIFYGNTIETIENLPIEINDEKKAKERIKKKLKNQKIFSQLEKLSTGDYLVHLDHGIARFSGMAENAIQNQHSLKYYVLEYAHGDKLYVPVGLERKLSKYVGFTTPKISRLSTQIWLKTKRKAKEEAEKTAKELLEIYAKREITIRSPYLRDTGFEFKIEETFPYLETPDQSQAIADIAKDLEESETPMDRIICGDVGFGKTEIALRAIVKAVSCGKQAAMICPTTILAYQHFNNFKIRLNNLPINIAMLSRIQSQKEQKEILEKLKSGKIDILIGTHRVLSDDVKFLKLEMLVIDDEQKFGVEQKEKLKKIRPSMDILSLSATPIPRTLYFALSSLKSITIVKTPPLHRLPIKTSIKQWSKEIIKKAVYKEFARNGQVYFLHNRIETIQGTKLFLEKLIPEAKIGIAHGRMTKAQLLKTINEFQNKKTNILIATTIIENGIDLPNVNTLIVSDATRLGLSQAYQIRGRVGRSDIQAFSYFLYKGQLKELAEKRLKALKEAKELGSGYEIALKDMEIRGAGNILGKEQSGAVNQVGLNLYCQMLSEAIEKQTTNFK